MPGTYKPLFDEIEGEPRSNTSLNAEFVAVEQAIGGKSNNGHGHSQSDIAGLSASLSSIAGVAQGANQNASAAVDAVNQLDSNKADIGHTHDTSAINGLDLALESKADASDVANLWNNLGNAQLAIIDLEAGKADRDNPEQEIVAAALRPYDIQEGDSGSIVLSDGSLQFRNASGNPVAETYGLDDLARVTALTAKADLLAGKHTAAQSRSSSLSYNASNGNVTLTGADGQTSTIDLPIELLLQNASYNSTTKQVAFTLNSGTTFTVSLADLVDLPEIEVRTSDPVATPTSGQRVCFRSDNGNYWISNGTAWVGPYLNITSAERTKLAGIATNATANSADAFLLSRANHTDQQPASTISDFAAVARSSVQTVTYDFTRTTAPAGATGGSGTWSFQLPSWVRAIQIIAVSAGAGGGSGRRGAAGTNRSGGGGGAPGGTTIITHPITGGSVLTINVGAGGIGGAAVLTDDTNGNGGIHGGNSSVLRAGNLLCGSGGGNGASGGTTTNGSAGHPPAFNMWAGGGSNGAIGTGGEASQTNAWPLSTGGSGGGGVNWSNVSGNGQRGGINFVFQAGSYGTNAGPGQNGTTAFVTDPNAAYGYPGGGGGGGNDSGTGGNGGNGAGYGAGGGGGGASVNGFASGAGGNGGDGFVRIICW